MAFDENEFRAASADAGRYLQHVANTVNGDLARLGHFFDDMSDDIEAGDQTSESILRALDDARRRKPSVERE